MAVVSSSNRTSPWQMYGDAVLQSRSCRGKTVGLRRPTTTWPY